MKTTLESLKQGKAPDSGSSGSKVYDVTDNWPSGPSVNFVVT
jgi:hypothetical protein